ncbi:hypothetical protein DYB32_003504 [Aphanomyces invadans]|uniref:Uncharacterized protein n=1 Tax=Aphanomyces invadans TaxID=157072 RepID=A0A3R6ZSE0_9STRA|nr:hypothetical protein DYB32_003504 [Aphanomyces invadans]
MAPMMTCNKTRLSFILAGPTTDVDDNVTALHETGRTVPPQHFAHGRHLLAPLSKKRALPPNEVNSPIESRQILDMPCSPAHKLTKLTAVTNLHYTSKLTPRANGEVASSSSKSSLKTSLSKRAYNLERPQALRANERQERHALRSHVEQVEATWSREHQQRLVNLTTAPGAADLARESDSTFQVFQALSDRTRQYAHFSQDMAQWVTTLQYQTHGDMQWLTTLGAGAASPTHRQLDMYHQHAGRVGAKVLERSTQPPHTAIQAPTKAKPLPTLKVDLSHLPPGARKRMYNRLRQRLYRQRELEEVDALNTYASELSSALVQLHAAKSANLQSMPRGHDVAASAALHEAIEQNATLKAKLRQHCALNDQLQQWVHHVSDVMHLDRQLLFTTA